MNTASNQVDRNAASLARAKEAGRRPIRGILSDKDVSDMYEKLISDVPKKQIGLVLSAMVKLAYNARENGELVIDGDRVELKNVD